MTNLFFLESVLTRSGDDIESVANIVMKIPI